MSDDPYRDRMIHFARLVSTKGGISPWCATRPRPVDLSRATWTLDRSAVTCPQCLSATAPPEEQP